MLAEQASQNAAKVEEAYGGFVQRASDSSLSLTLPFFFPRERQLMWVVKNKNDTTDVVQSDQESWTGIASQAADLEREHEHEYSDEEQLATVTVVEDFDPSAPLYHATASDADHHPPAEQGSLPSPLQPPPPPPPPRSSREKAAASRKDGGVAKNVRYETKAARRATRATQRARRTEKAERAGGKAARKRAGGKNKPRARK